MKTFQTDVDDDNASAAQAAMQKANSELARRRKLAPKVDAEEEEKNDGDSLDAAQAEMAKNNRQAARRKAAK